MGTATLAREPFMEAVAAARPRGEMAGEPGRAVCLHHRQANRVRSHGRKRLVAAGLEAERKQLLILAEQAARGEPALCQRPTDNSDGK
jgi:hypothetical protein